jgi:hypothetical protein
MSSRYTSHVRGLGLNGMGLIDLARGLMVDLSGDGFKLVDIEVDFSVRTSLEGFVASKIQLSIECEVLEGHLK